MKSLKQLDLEELEALSSRIENTPHEMAMLFFPDRPEYRGELTEMIGQWALHQQMVLESKSLDMPDVAIVFEKTAYRIWQRLPGYARSVQVEVA